MVQEKVLRSCGTHDGSFHADEVTACALLLLFDLIDRDKIVRTREGSLLNQCEYVCDVGGIYDQSVKRFDHHQVEYRGHLSSAGMILLYLKVQGIIDNDLYSFFNRSLISGIDAHDNGQVEKREGVCTISEVISNYMSIEYSASKDELRKAFDSALDFVFGHLKRLKQRYEYIKSCREEVAKCMEKKEDVLIFEHSMPWIDSFFELGGEKHPAQFVVMPSGNHWKLRGIPPNSQMRMRVRKPLPAEWAGLLEGDLLKVCGIPGAIFCHKGRFISVWRTKEDALKALDYTLKVRS